MMKMLLSFPAGSNLRVFHQFSISLVIELIGILPQLMLCLLRQCLELG